MQRNFGFIGRLRVADELCDRAERLPRVRVGREGEPQGRRPEDEGRNERSESRLDFLKTFFEVETLLNLFGVTTNVETFLG